MTKAELRGEIAALRFERDILAAELKAEEMHDALGPDETCAVCNHLEMELEKQASDELYAENERLIAELERLTR